MNATDPKTNVPTWSSVRLSRLPSLNPILNAATALLYYWMLKSMFVGWPCRFTATVR